MNIQIHKIFVGSRITDDCIEHNVECHSDVNVSTRKGEKKNISFAIKCGYVQKRENFGKGGGELGEGQHPINQSCHFCCSGAPRLRL